MANTKTLLWGAVGFIGAVLTVEEFTSVALPEPFDTVFELPLDFVILGLGLVGWMA